MLDYAVKLTEKPWEVGEADIAELKRAGYEDRAISDICQVVAYFNFDTRLVDGLGIEIEAYWKKEDIT